MTALNAPGLGGPLRRHRNLEAARHAQHGRRRRRDPGGRQGLERAGKQAIGDEVVEPRDDDRESKTLAWSLPSSVCMSALCSSFVVRRSSFGTREPLLCIELRLPLFQKRPGAFFHVASRGDQTEQRRLELDAPRRAEVGAPVHGGEHVAKRQGRLRGKLTASVRASSISAAAGTTRLTRPIRSASTRRSAGR